jgi:GT2 family glycosyltransferase
MTAAAPPLVSIALLTYESQDCIAATLDAVAAQTYPTVELLVLDNASSDATRDVLTARGVDFTVSADNVGFVRGMNALYERTTGDYIVFLNADCLLAPTFVERAVDTAQRCGADVVGANVVRTASVTEPVEFATAPLDGGRLGVGLDMRVRFVRPIAGAGPQHAFKANGACPVVSRRLIEALGAEYGHGPFSPAFHTYGEDIDFCFRAAAAGGVTVFDPELRAAHVRSASSGQISVRSKRGILRTYLLAARHLNVHRHHRPPMRVVVAAWLWAQDLVLCALQVVGGDRDAVRDIHRAHVIVRAARSELHAFRVQHATWRRWSLAAARVGAKR